jgi:predicted dehydrogenase
MSIRIAIIGAGSMASFHARGFRAAGAEVAALVDSDAARATTMAARLNIARVYPSVAALMDGEHELDAVAVLLPNALHAPVVIQALKDGLHVLCEKPPALNADEVRTMRDAARSNDRVLRFNLNNRYRPEAQALMAYRRTGEFGRINAAQAVWVRRCGIPGFGGWFTSKSRSGGGALIDLLHMLDLSLWLMDYPVAEHILASTWSDFSDDRTRKGPWGMSDGSAAVDVEMAAQGAIALRGGGLLTFRTSWAEMVEGERIALELQGSIGGALMERTYGIDSDDDTAADRCLVLSHEHGHPVNRTLILPHDPDMGRVASASAFICACAGHETSLGTPDQAVALMSVIDAIYASARNRAPVSLAETASIAV